MASLEDSIQLAADIIFRKYDLDQNGYLCNEEMAKLIGDAHKAMGVDRKITKKDIQNFMGGFQPARTGFISN